MRIRIRQLVRALLVAMTGLPILNLLFGAVAAWAAHSSVAVVLLVISLTYSSFITPVAAFALVLGANLGSAINPLLEGGGLGNPVARRLPPTPCRRRLRNTRWFP